MAGSSGTDQSGGGGDPLRARHLQAEAAFVRFGGAARAPDGGDAGGEGVEIVATFGELEAEYAAIRKGCVLIDLPHRGALEVRGGDRLDFLQRMLTQDVGRKALPAWRAARSFWLSRKGRIDADLRLIETEARCVVDLDRMVAASAARTLGEFVFAEDVAIEDRSATFRRLAMHGPLAPRALAAALTRTTGPSVDALKPGWACEGTIEGVDVLVDRHDTTGEIGFEFLVPVEGVARVWETLLSAVEADDGGRAAGWHAYNIARIEAGWPLFLIDFGPANLPHESGVLRDRVSFSKGCYLGQEIVARMESLGRPKQSLVAVRIDEAPQGEQIAPPDRPPEHPSEKALTANTLRQPETGAAVFGAEGDEPIGAVTSSALSPMLGDAPIAFAQVRTQHAAAGAALRVATPGGLIGAKVQDGLTFWRRG